MRHRPLLVATLLAALAVVAPDAQAPLVRFNRVFDRVNLGGAFGGGSPITTSLDDARTMVESMDGFTPAAFQSLAGQPQDEGGVFQLRPGAYEFTAQSYCLHAGTHGPGRGDGYVYAPLDGSKGDIIRAVLRNSVAQPRLPQQDVQVLVWAILARTPLGEMPRDARVTATRLLTPVQLLELDRGAIGLAAMGSWRGGASVLPPALRRVMEVETGMRQLFARSDARFEEIERMAVLLGDPHPDPASRDIPSTRWSYHPGGYFIRFDPSGYDRTAVLVYVPESAAVVRDEGGRVVGLDLARAKSRPSEGERFRFFSRAGGPSDAAPIVGWREGERSSWAARSVSVDLSESVAVPGVRGRQRLALSARAAR
jgi:hypothetical protein